MGLRELSRGPTAQYVQFSALTGATFVTVGEFVVARFRLFLQRRFASDRGLSLIEVMVALMVFGIIAVGVAFSLANILTIAQDSRARSVAHNLAAEMIDTTRAEDNIFSIGETTKKTTVGGTTYSVKRSAGWVRSSSDAAGCTSVAGELESKWVNVAVTWDGMRKQTTPVQSETLIAPNKRLNDPSLGTIQVSVSRGGGGAASGLGVSVTGVSGGAAAPLEPPRPTDAQGCSYVVRLKPGEYKVSVGSAADIDATQKPGPATKTVVVTAGTTTGANFQIDRPLTIAAEYASNATGPVLLPTNINATYISTYSSPIRDGSRASLHPFNGGYRVVAGAYSEPQNTTDAGCLSPDPGSWVKPAPSDGAIGQATVSVGGVGGATVTAPVAMGLFTVAAGGKHVTAVRQSGNPDSDDPGCAVTGPNYAFPPVGGETLALPFGTWKLFLSDTPGGTSTPVPADAITLVSRGEVSGDLLLDPREVQP